MKRYFELLMVLIVSSDMHKNKEKLQDRSDLSTVLTENIFLMVEKFIWLII